MIERIKVVAFIATAFLALFACYLYHLARSILRL